MEKPLLNATSGLKVTHLIKPLARHSEHEARSMVTEHLAHDAVASLDERCIECAHAKIDTMIDYDHKHMEPKIHAVMRCDRARGGCHYEVKERMKGAWEINQYDDSHMPKRPTSVVTIDPDVPENSTGAW